MSKKMVVTAVCLLAMSAMMAQNITGKVVDTKGEPLPFANVMLLNRADSAFVKGAVSGEDGSFTINASCNGGIIKVSSVGYTTVFQDCVGGDLGVVRLSYKIPCSGVISRPAASTSCRSFFITSAGIHLRSTLTVRTRLRLRTMSIGA